MTAIYSVQYSWTSALSQGKFVPTGVLKMDFVLVEFAIVSKGFMETTVRFHRAPLLSFMTLQQLHAFLVVLQELMRILIQKHVLLVILTVTNAEMNHLFAQVVSQQDLTLNFIMILITFALANAQVIHINLLIIAMIVIQVLTVKLVLGHQQIVHLVWMISF